MEWLTFPDFGFLICKNEESNSHLFWVASGFKGDNVREGDMHVTHCSIKICCCHHMGFLRSSEMLSIIRVFLDLSSNEMSVSN